ncbi:MAG: metallophosphoesterase [Planctomycetes bacterium]|nr:metallophosphoesterase [Planctomycetota bacterium]
MPPPERIYLLADLHLKPLDAPSRAAQAMAVAENERLARFLAAIDGKASGLILLGDVFNFWFERKSRVVGDYYTSLSLFKLAAERGLDIHHVSGNRDFVVGEGLGFDPTTRYPGFFRFRRGFTVSRLADFGIEPHGYRYRFHHCGKTVSCLHGDALCTGDRLFMALRWALQGPVGRWLFRWAPWSCVDFAIRRQQARTGIRGGDGRRSGDLIDTAAARKELAMGADLVVCGHIHAHHERGIDFAGRQGQLVAVPPFLAGGYGVLENGTVRVGWFDGETAD